MSPKPTHYDVIILGAGAAGLFCALTAGKRERRVLLLEKSNKIGKKILMSGGGRCNFTNQVVDADNFISGNRHFCKAALNRYSQWDFINMVEAHGIDYEQRKHSQLFCIDSAKNILNMLLRECEHAGVTIKANCDVSNIGVAHTGNTYQMTLQQRQSTSLLSCDSLVVATGGLSIPTLGGSGLGYEIASQFDLTVTEKRAGLVPFMFTDENKALFDRLSGLSLEVSVQCNGQSFTEQLLFTHRGLSGPVILQISNYWHQGDEITIDLLPDIEATAWLLQAKAQQGKIFLKNLVAQNLSKALAAELESLWWPEQSEIRVADFLDKELIRIGRLINQWQLKPSATEGYRTAEVTLGGVDTNSVSSKTMEVKDQPGLYIIGEVLDVSGHLGGFNFQWAWSSGYSAGLFV